MEKQKYDKKRITSTVILTIFFLLTLLAALPFVGVTWADIKAAVDSNSSESSSAGEAIVGGSAIAFAGALAMVLVLIIYFGVIIVDLICLPFAINNRKSTLKAIRIYSYVLDGLFGALLILSIVKVLLILAGV